MEELRRECERRRQEIELEKRSRWRRIKRRAISFLDYVFGLGWLFDLLSFLGFGW